jgi:hypothetical protein
MYRIAELAQTLISQIAQKRLWTIRAMSRALELPKGIFAKLSEDEQLRVKEKLTHGTTIAHFF